MLEAQALATAKSGKLDPYNQVQTLGKLEIFDPNLSVNNNIACSYCHDPAAGYGNGASILSVFTGGSNPGSVPITVHGAYPNNRIAKRNPQSYVYASYFPPLHYNQSQADFYGGNFWDGRATGYKLQNSAANQAQGPPLDTQEMANPDSACVVWKLSLSKYKFFFEQVFGVGSLELNWPSDVQQICSTPAGAAVLGGNPTPLQLSPTDRTLANKDFDEFAQAIASYEGSDSVSPFTSKFDYYLAGKATLTAQEQNGYDLFRGKGSCNTCHLDGSQQPKRADRIAGRRRVFSLCSPTRPTTISVFQKRDTSMVFGRYSGPMGIYRQFARLRFHRHRYGVVPGWLLWCPAEPELGNATSAVRWKIPDFHGAERRHGALPWLRESLYAQRISHEFERGSPLLQHP